MNEYDIFPMTIVYGKKTIYNCLASKKSIAKTIEQHQAWQVHPKTHKVLPLEPRIDILKVQENDKGWYEAHASADIHDNTKNIESQNVRDTPEKNQSVKDLNADREFLQELYNIVVQRKKAPQEGSYTQHLFDSGVEKIRKKVGEEAIEVILAKSKKDITEESAYLLYHLIVLLVEQNIDIKECMAVLRARNSKQGEL